MLRSSRRWHTPYPIPLTGSAILPTQDSPGHWNPGTASQTLTVAGVALRATGRCQNSCIDNTICACSQPAKNTWCWLNLHISLNRFFSFLFFFPLCFSFGSFYSCFKNIKKRKHNTILFFACMCLAWAWAASAALGMALAYRSTWKTMHIGRASQPPPVFSPTPPSPAFSSASVSPLASGPFTASLGRFLSIYAPFSHILELFLLVLISLFPPKLPPKLNTWMYKHACTHSKALSFLSLSFTQSLDSSPYFHSQRRVIN